MKKMQAYISAAKAISPQQSFTGSFPWTEPENLVEFMKAREPVYKEYISPVKLRRMSRIVKMGLIAATECLRAAEIKNPEAVITTTGWGCLTDTYKFLNEIRDRQEEALSPATFIQSTHNTVGGQIALHLGCQEYNSVYVNHTSSFEHGLLDALMLIEEGKNNVLIGGLDELTETDYRLKQQTGFWKTGNISGLSLPESNTAGTIPGEGSAFFLLKKTPDKNAQSVVRGVAVSSLQSAEKCLDVFLRNTEMKRTDIDTVLCGLNGDRETNVSYTRFLQASMSHAMPCYYKHLCGQYDTASSYALWLANAVLQTQKVPDYLLLDNRIKQNHSPNHVLIYHFKEPDEHAFILVSKAGL